MGKIGRWWINLACGDCQVLVKGPFVHLPDDSVDKEHQPCDQDERVVDIQSTKAFYSDINAKSEEKYREDHPAPVDSLFATC